MLAQNVQLEQSGDIVVATITTPLMSVSEGQELVESLNERMRYDGVRNFILDMTEVEFMDSGCVGALVQLLQDLEHIHGKIALANCQSNVAFLFKVTRLDSVFGLHESVEDAREALKHH